MTTRRTILRLAPVAALAALAACSSGQPAGSPRNGASLSVDAFATAMSSPGTTIIDVRTPAEFSSGHLAGARNLDVEASDFEQRVTTLDKAASYAVYCHSGRRSGVAVETMRRLGFTSVYDLAGGVGAWTAAGRPLVH